MWVGFFFFFAWVLRGKPLSDVIVQKSPQHFGEKRLLCGLSGQAGLLCEALTAKCYTVLSFFLHSPRQNACTLGSFLPETEQGDSSQMHWKWYWMLSDTLVPNPSSITHLPVWGNPLNSWKVVLSICNVGMIRKIWLCENRNTLSRHATTSCLWS